MRLISLAAIVVGPPIIKFWPWNGIFIEAQAGRLGGMERAPAGTFMAALSREIPLSSHYDPNGRHPTERRKRARMHVHWPIRFFGPDSAKAVETITCDLSSDGFHCRAKAPFVVGDSWTCTLNVPANDPTDGGRTLLVECTVRIVWTRLVDELHHIGCRIEGYRFLDSLVLENSSHIRQQAGPST